MIGMFIHYLESQAHIQVLQKNPKTGSFIHALDDMDILLDMEYIPYSEKKNTITIKLL